MKENISLLEEKKCTGCMMCQNICPHNAITMIKNDEGFFFPKVAEEKCTRCGICYKRCPAVNTTYINQGNSVACYAMQAEDEIRKKSSSGGAFTILANHFLDNDGVVCGAVFNKDLLSVSHILIESKDELDKMRRSKYLQSDIGFSYREIKRVLLKGKKVLFVGCPCQCAGLRAYLGNDYSSLLIVDIVCHGVPSSKVFEEFVDSLDYFSMPTEVNFREKKNYGWTPTMDIKFANGKEYYKPKWECIYYDAFLKGIACRLSCGNCPFAKIPRQGDITLGDFWGIEKTASRFNDSLGTSLVLINNKKGKEYISEFKKYSKLFEKSDIEIARKDNWNIFGSSTTNGARERYFTLIKKYGFNETMNRIKYRHFEIGVIGWWYGKNYGSGLTYFALNRFLHDLGYDVLMLEWPVHSKPAPISTNSSRELAKEYYQCSIQRTFSEYAELNKYIDVFVVGSDQMWNWWDQKGMGYYYFLDFVDKEHPKVSISTSFGHEKYMAPNEAVEKQKSLLKSFSAVSVREKAGVSICKEFFDVNATQILDPVFLADKNYYYDLISEEKRPYDEAFLLCYILTPTKEKGEYLQRVAQQTGLRLVVCLDNQTSLEDNKKELGIEDVELNVGIKKWLAFIRYADLIVTDSYHGTCFSILFDKNFFCIINQKRGASRFEALLELCGLQNRGINDIIDIENKLQEGDIDYSKVYEKLSPEIEFSKKWIERSLSNAMRERKKLMTKKV